MAPSVWGQPRSGAAVPPLAPLGYVAVAWYAWWSKTGVFTALAKGCFYGLDSARIGGARWQT